MKKLAFIAFTLLLFAVADINAQPAGVKKAANAVFTLTTFKADGTILATTHGIFIDNDGTALTTFSPFVGAFSATVIDARGKSMPVDYIIGANELYDVAKIKVEGLTSAVPLTNKVSKNTKVWLVPYALGTPSFTQTKIAEIEKFNTSYNYYIFDTQAPENTNACPFVTQEGKVIGLLVHSNTDNDVHAIDALFADSLKVNGLSSLDPALKQTQICTALPNKEPDALLTLMMAKESSNKKNLAKYIRNYINKFPTSAEGYKQQAELDLTQGDSVGADKMYQDAITKAVKKDEAHYNYANAIYFNNGRYPGWTMDKAYQEAETAYRISPLPVYNFLMAQSTFGKGDYSKAYDMFMKLTKSSLRNAEIFVDAAQCKKMMKAPEQEIISLLDSAVNVYPKPIFVKDAPLAAPGYLARGNEYFNLGKYREAVMDYNEYDTLSFFRSTPQFYYIRYKCEMQIHQWQQALNDIAHAIVLNPNEPTYYAEMASLELRVNQLNDAIRTAQRCTEIAPQYSDGYLLLGLAQVQNNQKADGLANLNKAKELGDNRADQYIKKYK